MLTLSWLTRPVCLIAKMNNTSKRVFILGESYLSGRNKIHNYFNGSHRDGRVVKALDLSSNGRMSAWVRTPLSVTKFSPRNFSSSEPIQLNLITSKWYAQIEKLIDQSATLHAIRKGFKPPRGKHHK